MAVRALQRPPVIEVTQAPPVPPPAMEAAPAPNGHAPTGAVPAAAGGSGKPIVMPELRYFVFLVVVLAVGFAGALILDDGTRVWAPGPEVSAFALIFVMTTAIERVIEIFSPFVGGTVADDEKKPEGAELSGRVGKQAVVAARDKALAEALGAPTVAAAKTVAWHDELLAQIRANKSTLWAAGAALGMLAAGTMGILLLHYLKVPSVSREVDILVTGLVIGGGSKALHELVANVRAGKEAKEEAAGG